MNSREVITEMVKGITNIDKSISGKQVVVTVDAASWAVFMTHVKKESDE